MARIRMSTAAPSWPMCSGGYGDDVAGWQRLRPTFGKLTGETGKSSGALMPEAAKLLAEWENFYVIVGSSAAALTGLMFVVIALIADSAPAAATPRSIAAYTTPTIVHFCAALLASVI